MNLKMVMPLLCGALLLSLSACGGGPNLVPVKGKVTVDGTPLETGSVAFWPDGSGQEASGDIAKDGTYELYTNKMPGAVPGKYKVTVVAQKGGSNIKPNEVERLVNEKFSIKESSNLKIEVIENPEAGRYDLKVSK
jgi:hypothetical protein